MSRSLNKCINCNANKVGSKLCPSCGIVYAKEERIFFEKLIEELRKEGHENLASSRKKVK